MRAWNLTRSDAIYRHASFSAGLRAAGYDVQKGAPGDVKPGEVVLGWNRYGGMHDLATRVEKAGGIYVCAENGYLAEGGLSPHSQNPRTVFALGIGYHNDASVIRGVGAERWNALGIDLKPWRADGGHILVCPNRSFGVPGRMMPPNWANEVCARLRKLTKREVRLRPHPGNDPPKRPLAEDLAGAWATVIWSSSAGVHALIEGIPVICEAPYWILKGATCENWQARVRGGVYPRRRHFERLAWAQWNLGELESGEAFRALLTTAPVKA